MIFLDEIKKSALQEIGNIGAGNAAVALSQLMGKKIMLAVPKVKIATWRELVQEIGSALPIIGTHLRVLGKVEGEILFFLSRENALLLADAVLKQALGSTKGLGVSEESTLKEVGSILSAAYLNALSRVMELVLIPSAPVLLSTALKEACASVFEKGGGDSDVLVGIENEFIEASVRIKGYFLFMPSPEGFKALLEGLGVGGE